MGQRRKYAVNLKINEIQITHVVIDSHYEIAHGDSINDDIILDIVQLLNGLNIDPEKVVGKFQYFKSEPLHLNDMSYRLIWLLEDSQLYIGVANAFRRS